MSFGQVLLLESFKNSLLRVFFPNCTGNHTDTFTNKILLSWYVLQYRCRWYIRMIKKLFLNQRRSRNNAFIFVSCAFRRHHFSDCFSAQSGCTAVLYANETKSPVQHCFYPFCSVACLRKKGIFMQAYQ